MISKIRPPAFTSGMPICQPLITWDRLKDKEFVVVLSNSDDGFKEMNLGDLNSNRKFIDITGSFDEAVITNDEGIAIFPVKSCNISIWIKEEALDAVQ